jgi:hypothetical protein
MATKKKPKPPRFFRHFDTTIPKIQPCASCGCWLAAGVAEGIHAKVDIVVLDPVQAALATIAGVRLYALTGTGLVELDSYRLRDPKFGRPYPRHRCGVVWESRLPAAGAVRRSYESDTPPY